MREWETKAECSKYNPELWFPNTPSGAHNSRRDAWPKAICAVCPVRLECLSASLKAPEGTTLLHREGPELWGIWGGITELERRDAWKQSGHNITRTLAILDQVWHQQLEANLA